MNRTKKNNSVISSIAGMIVSLFSKSPKNNEIEYLKKADFKSSTQKIGISFTEKIRNTFRHKWIRKS